MTYAKVQTADIALALAGAVLAGLVGWRPGIIPAWGALVPIGVLILGTLVLVPHQILIAHEGWASTRQARQAEELLKEIRGNEAATVATDAEAPRLGGAE